MGKVTEIWQIIKRKDWKDGDEVHAAHFDGGILVSHAIYESLKPKLSEYQPPLTNLGDIYGVKILETSYLPYIYREVKKKATEVRHDT